MDENKAQALDAVYRDMMGDPPTADELMAMKAAWAERGVTIGQKAATYAVQSFHGNFGKADENAKWSFSGADGNAILDKGGWPLYKQVHLVVDTSDGATPENKAAYTYPVAKLVDGKPTYFLKSAQTVYAGLRGGARGAKLPATTNDKVLATVKRIYKAFGRETEEMGLKGGFTVNAEGKTVFAGSAGMEGAAVEGGGVIPQPLGGGVQSVNYASLEAEMTPEAQGLYARGVYDFGEAMTQSDKRSEYVDAVYNALSATERIELASRYLGKLDNYADVPKTPQDSAALDGLYKAGLLNKGPVPLQAAAESGDRVKFEEGYFLNTLGKEVLPKMASKTIRPLAFAFKAADGTDWWMQWTTNAFQDREGENFQTKALEEFVDRHRGEKVKGEFWYHHIPGTKFGDVQFQAMVGRFLVQAGPFDNTPVAQAFKEFFSQYPNGHPQIASEGWGTSHGYQYNASDRKDNVYEWVEIKESTVLPRSAASNPWSPYPRIIQRSNVMNAQEKKELEAIGGKALVDLVTREGEQRTKELEGMGVGFKGLSGAMAKVMALMEGVEDPDIKAALSEIYDEMQSPDEEELPAPAEGEMALNEEVAVTEEAPLPMAMAAAGKPEVKVKEAPVDTATRTEVAEAMAALTTELRSEVKAAVDAQTKTIVDALTPLLAEVKELRKQDTQKIAEKAAATPAASLREMVQSVLESKKAQVEDGDPLLARKPQEAPFTQRPEGGMPSFLANMFGK